MTTAEDWCLKALGYQFSDAMLLTQALTHRSASPCNNERLEFLGDAVLGLAIAHALYKKKPAAGEGSLSRLRSDLVRRETLVELAMKLDLGPQVLMGAGERRSGGDQRTSLLANALEAVLGAVLLDGGFSAASEVILRVFGERLADLPDAADVIDPKTRLQEYLQGRQLPPPEYSLKATTGAAHARTFEASCGIPGLELETAGTGSSRRRAEQAAAARALEQLGDG